MRSFPVRYRIVETREWVLPFAVDVRLTLSVQGRGRGDPTFRLDEAGAIWRTSLTPVGPATLRVTAVYPAPVHPPGQGNEHTPLDGVSPEPPAVPLAHDSPVDPPAKEGGSPFYPPPAESLAHDPSVDPLAMGELCPPSQLP